MDAVVAQSIIYGAERSETFNNGEAADKFRQRANFFPEPVGAG